MLFHNSRLQTNLLVDSKTTTVCKQFEERKATVIDTDVSC